MLRICRSYLEQVEVIILPHPPEVVLHIVFVAWVEIAGLNHHLSVIRTAKEYSANVSLANQR